MEKKILIGEVKLNKDKININSLKVKSEKLVNKYKNFTSEYTGLGLQDLEKYI